MIKGINPHDKPSCALKTPSPCFVCVTSGGYPKETVVKPSAKQKAATLERQQRDKCMMRCQMFRAILSSLLLRGARTTLLVGVPALLLILAGGGFAVVSCDDAASDDDDICASFPNDL